jgi:adenylate cyclase
VLPFANSSGDPEQEYFSDGVAEDILTTLSKSRALFVIARNSTFTYKGKATAITDIGRELGVRYVLEGSIRKAGSRIRVTTRLVDAATGRQLWAEHYDRDVADVFLVQDEIAASVCEAIQPRVERSERERAARKAPERLDAWECYHRGMWHLASTEAAENAKARGFFARAIQLDPQFARADAALAQSYLNEVTIFRPDLRKVNVALALEHARNAVKKDTTDAAAHAVLARALWMLGSHEESLAEADLAVSFEPNSAVAHGAQGGARVWGGRPRDAIKPLQTAMRLSPFDPQIPLWLHYVARAHYLTQDYVASIRAAQQLRHSFPQFRPPYNTLLAALGQTGQVDEARVVLADAMERFNEAFRTYMSLPLNELRELRAEDREHLISGFRMAGLVE